MTQGIPGSRGVCSIDGCTGLHFGHGWCQKHYYRWRRHGDPLGLGGRVAPDPNRRCSVDGCDRRAIARGWCSKHYKQWQLTGDPCGSKPRPTVAELFWAKVDRDGPVPEARPDLGPCWLWTASTTKDGYGCFGQGTGLAHRWVYEAEVGPIPEGYEVDHLCFVRPCVRPTHLEAVTQAENLRRSNRRRAKPAMT